MKKKLPLSVAIALIFVTMAVTAAVTVNVYMKIYNNLIKDLPERAQLYSKLSEIDELVRANYYGDVDTVVLDADIAKGYIEGLNDDYSFYMTAEEYKEYYNAMLGKISGIGVDAVFDDISGFLTVSDVASDSPAALAGIEKGCFIVSVNSQKVTADNYKALLGELAGEKLTSVNLEILPVDFSEDDTPKTVNVAKGYEAQSCFYSINGTIGYIKLTDFYENTAVTFSEAMTSFNESGVTGLIIDVRNNSSYNIDYAVKVIDLIVPLATEGTGAIAVTKNAAGETVKTYSADTDNIALPISVIINKNTEGAAELLACDLRDYGKAKLVGENTAGHGTVQEIFRLDDGGAVLLTVTKIFPYISDSYDKIGVAPDEEVIMSDLKNNQLQTLAQSEDDQYQAAYKLLTQ